VADARVTPIRPIKLNDYGIVFTDNGLMIAKGASSSIYLISHIQVYDHLNIVFAMYAKRGGKNGKHEAITESSNISAVSYMPVQLFEHMYDGQFRFITEATSIFQTKHYMLLPPAAFLCLLSKELQVNHTGLGITAEDTALFSELQAEQPKFTAAMKLFRERCKNDDNSE
jgi:hypothetical protein